MKLKNCAIIEPSPLDSKITGINYDDGSTKDTFTKCILSLDRHKNLPIHFATSNGWPKCLKEMLGHLKGEYSAYEYSFNNFINQCSDGDNEQVMADQDIHDSDNVEENEDNRGCLDSLQL